MARPIEDILQELKELYGKENSQPIINAIETRENWRAIKLDFEKLKERYPYEECIQILIEQHSASRSLVKKSIHKTFPNNEPKNDEQREIETKMYI